MLAFRTLYAAAVFRVVKVGVQMYKMYKTKQSMLQKKKKYSKNHYFVVSHFSFAILKQHNGVSHKLNLHSKNLLLIREYISAC